MSVSLPVAPRPKQRRADHPKAANLCEHCTAKCCHYFALPIDEPTERREYAWIRLVAPESEPCREVQRQLMAAMRNAPVRRPVVGF